LRGYNALPDPVEKDGKKKQANLNPGSQKEEKVFGPKAFTGDWGQILVTVASRKKDVLQRPLRRVGGAGEAKKSTEDSILTLVFSQLSRG